MRNLLILFSVLLILSSCHNTQPLFSNHPNPDANKAKERLFLTPTEPVLSIGDKITVSIWEHEELSIGSLNSIYNSNEESGKWVVLDYEGKVNLPKIGRIKLSELTTKEASYLLEQQYGRILNDPIINVKVLNHFVTVVGEVNKPGRYNLQNEMVSLIEIIGMAEGLTIYAKNDQIEVVRIIEGKPAKLTVNLTDLASLPLKNITLQPDDVIYVGPTKRKEKDRNLSKATLVASIITGLAVLVSVFVK